MLAATIAAAFAAFCSAIAALLLAGISRRSLNESLRPELVLMDWSRADLNAHCEMLRVRAIRNVGRGAAFNIVFHGHEDTSDDRPLYSMTTRGIPLLPSGEEIELNEGPVLCWDNADPSEDGQPLMRLRITILCLDRSNNHHETSYDLAAFKDPNTYCGEVVAPGLMSLRRPTKTTPRWRVRSRPWLNKRLPKRFRRSGWSRSSRSVPI